MPVVYIHFHYHINKTPHTLARNTPTDAAHTTHSADTAPCKSVWFSCSAERGPCGTYPLNIIL